MKILDMLPQLDADALATVRINALRLVEHGNPKQKKQASEALPLIEAEQTRRADAAPPKIPKVRAKAKPKLSAKAAAAAATLAAEEDAGDEDANDEDTGEAADMDLASSEDDDLDRDPMPSDDAESDRTFNDTGNLH